MLNHGMGYYSRYFVDAGQETPPLDQVDLDQYRASEIAFGHAGFLGDGIAGVRDWLALHAPEYWLIQALQSRYADAECKEIAYFDGSGFCDTETALRRKLPLAQARIRLSYSGGLVVFVNRDTPVRTASSIGDFAGEQGERGWSYYEETPQGLVPMAWDPEKQRWQGSRRYLILTQMGGHPDGGAAVRVFTVPVTGKVRIAGRVEDVNLTCGDGVIAQVFHESRLLWERILPAEDGSSETAFDLRVEVSAGDRILFRLDQKETNGCDSTYFTAAVSWNDGEDHDWTVSTPEGT